MHSQPFSHNSIQADFEPCAQERLAVIADMAKLDILQAQLAGYPNGHLVVNKIQGLALLLSPASSGLKESSGLKVTQNYAHTRLVLETLNQP